MANIIAVHSFRGGTGKSNIAANVAAILAQDGARVGVVDTDIQSPGIHVLFGLGQETMRTALNDYLWGSCPIEQTAYEVTSSLGASTDGALFLIPSSIKAGEIARVLHEGYNVDLLNDGFRTLIEALRLDTLIIDTHPGLNEETLLSIAMADALAVVLRPDQQDYAGTGVTVQVARKLDVPRLLVVLNKVPAILDTGELRSQVERTYNCEVAAVLPHADELMVFGSAGIFSARYPDHPISVQFRQLAAILSE